VAGLALGFVLIALVQRTSSLVTPEDPLGGMVRLVAINMLGMFLAVGVLIFLFVYLRTALLPFGLGLVFGFISSAVVRFLRGSGTVRTSD